MYLPPHQQQQTQQFAGRVNPMYSLNPMQNQLGSLQSVPNQAQQQSLQALPGCNPATMHTGAMPSLLYSQQAGFGAHAAPAPESSQQAAFGGNFGLNPQRAQQVNFGGDGTAYSQSVQYSQQSRIQPEARSEADAADQQLAKNEHHHFHMLDKLTGHKLVVPMEYHMSVMAGKAPATFLPLGVQVLSGYFPPIEQPLESLAVQLSTAQQQIQLSNPFPPELVYHVAQPSQAMSPAPSVHTSSGYNNYPSISQEPELIPAVSPSRKRFTQHAFSNSMKFAQGDFSHLKQDATSSEQLIAAARPQTAHAAGAGLYQANANDSQDLHSLNYPEIDPPAAPYSGVISQAAASSEPNLQAAANPDSNPQAAASTDLNQQVSIHSHAPGQSNVDTVQSPGHSHTASAVSVGQQAYQPDQQHTAVVHGSATAISQPVVCSPTHTQDVDSAAAGNAYSSNGLAAAAISAAAPQQYGQSSAVQPATVYSNNAMAAGSAPQAYGVVQQQAPALPAGVGSGMMGTPLLGPNGMPMISGV